MALQLFKSVQFDFSTTSVSTTFLTLSADTQAMTFGCDQLLVGDTGGEQMWLAIANTTSSAGATTTSAILIPPGGIEACSISIPSGSSLFIRSAHNTATTGQFMVTLFREA